MREHHPPTSQTTPNHPNQPPPPTGVDAGAVIPATILVFFLDRFLAGGQVFDQIARVLFPRYKVRVMRSFCCGAASSGRGRGDGGEAGTS